MKRQIILNKEQLKNFFYLNPIEFATFEEKSKFNTFNIVVENNKFYLIGEFSF